MDQPTLGNSESPPSSEEEGAPVPLPFLTADEADPQCEEPYVLVARDALEICRWLVAEAPGLQWIQVENLLEQPEVWATAARKGNDVALDVIVSDPATQFAAIYHLVDVRKVRPVRVTIPVVEGFMKSLRLAASIQVPVRLLPGQPDAGLVEELKEALEFYLHDPMVETPVEFFHSMLSAAGGVSGPDLWTATEEHPDIFALPETPAEKVPGFVERFFEELKKNGAECVSCRWKEDCRGYFKYPDPDYSCTGIIELLDQIGDAGREMEKDLAAFQPSERINPDSDSPMNQ